MSATTGNGRIRLVCFDLGGVVVRICRSWDEACAVVGLDRRECSSHPVAELLRLKQLHQTGAIDLDEFAAGASRAYGGLYSPDEIAAMHRSWILGEYEGVGEVIGRLNEAGVETAALSNTTADHWEQLFAYPAIARIAHRHASHLLGLAKPDPAIYRAFEERLGRRGGEIMFFDDLPDNIAAAREAGWNAVQIDPERCTATQIAAALNSASLLAECK
jgi:glucose-1-phosphatase